MKHNETDAKKYVEVRKSRSREFAGHYEKGREDFLIGAMIEVELAKAGMTQESLARKIRTQRTAVSRMIRRGTDFRVSTLEKVAHALGKKLIVEFR
jgi:DNA-binding phage protein